MTYYRSINIRASALQPNDVIVIDNSLLTSECLSVLGVVKFAEMHPRKIFLGLSNYTTCLIPWDRRLSIRRPANGPAMTPESPVEATPAPTPFADSNGHPKSIQAQLDAAREEYVRKVKSIVNSPWFSEQSGA